jgi:hypothetical protein
MAEHQNNLCAICQQPETATLNGKIKRLAVDHDHTTNQTRELLCNNCNSMLGYYNDNPELLEKAANYLKKHAV